MPGDQSPALDDTRQRARASTLRSLRRQLRRCSRVRIGDGESEIGPLGSVAWGCLKIEGACRGSGDRACERAFFVEQGADAASLAKPYLVK